jgi:hypothetical protein
VCYKITLHSVVYLGIFKIFYFLNYVFFKERAKYCLVEPEISYRSSVFIYELDLLYYPHFDVISIEDPKENTFNIFLGKCLYFYMTVKAYLKLCCDSHHSTNFVFNYELKML